MATPNVTINLTPQTVRARDIEREAEEAEKKRQHKVATIPDEYEAVSTKALAVAGEPARPPRKDKSRHEQIKHSFSNLKKAFTAAGGKNEKALAEKPEETVKDLAEKLAKEIKKLADKGGRKEEIEAVQKNLDDLESAFSDYQSAHSAEGGETALTTQAVQGSTEAEGAQTRTDTEQENLWASVEKAAKFAGIETTKGKDIEQVRKDFTDRMRGKVVELQSKVKELTSQKKELEIKLKTATPIEKIALEKLLKEVAVHLTQVNQKLLQYQKAFADFGKHADAILALETTKDLGLPAEPVVQTSPVKKEEKTVPPRGTALATASEGSQGGGEVSPDVPLAQGAPLIQTMGGGSDFSGTTLAIASTGSNVRSEARKTDKVLKKLLRAALAGNFEAIKTALIFLDKRASLVTVGMGAQTIKAMQSYEKQMSALSTNIGRLKGTEPDYNAQLAKINSEMNQYSMNRQAIGNFLRDTMSMKEEISNLTSSFLTKAGQISSTVSRWG